MEKMQDFFFIGIISAIALGVVIFKSAMFVIHLANLKKSDEIIEKNLARAKVANHQAQQIQKAMSSIENVTDWRVDDFHLLSEDLKQQFLTKSRTRRTPTFEPRASPIGQIPLATTDFDEVSDDDLLEGVPMYTYNPGIGGTQV